MFLSSVLFQESLVSHLRPEPDCEESLMFRTIVKAWLTTGLAVVAFNVASASAQTPAPAPDPDATSRAEAIAAEQVKKSGELTPDIGNKAEQAFERIEQTFLSNTLNFHPFFDSAYAGGGFTLGAGYRRYVSSYNTIDLRGSITFSGYKRIEAAFLAPRLFNRHAVLQAVGGWREATQVGFFGIGTPATSPDDRTNYSFQQPYAGATLEYRPWRNAVRFDAGLDYSQWKQGSGGGSVPSVEDVYTPATLPGLGSSPTYVHTGLGAALDTRVSPGYSRKGGYYGVAVENYADNDSRYGFEQVNYEAIQHIPILRDAWVLSLHARVQTTYTSDNDVVPFYMLPALGGGSSLRGFTSWRFRDRQSLLLQAEWRILANQFMDMAVFYDAGKVVARTSDIDLDGLKKDYGLGFRIHSPLATPLRIEFAKSNEGLQLVFAASASF